MRKIYHPGPITAPKARAQFRRFTTTSTPSTTTSPAPEPFRWACHLQPCWIDGKDWRFQRGKRAVDPDFLHSTDQNSPASDTDSSIENAMAAIKQSNETGNITFASIDQLSTAMSTLSNQSTAYSSWPTLPVAPVAVMPAMPPLG